MNIVFILNKDNNKFYKNNSKKVTVFRESLSKVHNM